MKKMIRYVYDRPRVVFFVVALMITGPMWWHGGYLFLLDWGVHVPEIDLWQHAVLRALLILCSSIIPYGLYQKIIFTGILWLLGVGGFWFVREVLHDVQNVRNRYITAYLGGLFMMVNPFVYGRMVDGQWIVVAGMIGIIFMIIQLLRWRRQRTVRHVLWAIVWAGVTVMLSQHAVFFVGMVSGLFFIGMAVVERNWRMIAWWVALCGGVLLMNINVVIGYVYNLSESSALLTQFDDAHARVFYVTRNGYLPIELQVLSLHGYWGEGENRFLSTQEHAYVWLPIFIIFSGLIVWGIVRGRKHDVTWFLVVCGICSLILAVGAVGMLGWITEFLYTHVPFYVGLREPHKWASILVICFDGLLMYGLYHVLQYCQRPWHRVVWICGVALMIVCYTPTMLWGFRGQVVPRDFPAEWYDVRAQYGCDMTKGKILFLPWHQYMEMDFLQGKNIVNPARGFFGSCVIQGSNMEADQIYTQIVDAQSRVLDAYATAGNDYDGQFVAHLRQYGVSYIILSASQDHTAYVWIERCEGIETVFDGGFLRVYAVRQR